MDAGKAGDQRRAVEALELVELRAVDQARDHLADVVLLLEVGRHDGVEVFKRVSRLDRLGKIDVDALARIEGSGDAPHDRQRMDVVGRVVVGDAGEAGMHVGAAELLGRDDLAGRGFEQRRAAEEDRALLAHDDGLVRHRRHIGAARRAGAHDAGDLRNAERGQRRLVVEDAAEMLAVREHLGLVRQVGAAGIDEVDAGQPVLARDLLRAQVLLHRHRVVGAALDGRVVADDHRLAPADAADAGDQPGAVDVVLVHAVRRKRAELEEGRARIDEAQHALARQELAAGKMPLARPLRAALGDRGAAPGELALEGVPGGPVRLRGVRSQIDRCLDDRHPAPFGEAQPSGVIARRGTRQCGSAP